MQKRRKNIVLVGFMGSGKSTLGKQLAKKLSMTYVDMDLEIERNEAMSISEIFELHGEKYFRSLETEMLKSFRSKDTLVISTGGGAPCFNNNIDVINEVGDSVYLKVPNTELRNRLIVGKATRPLIAKMNETELMAFVDASVQKREEFYAQCKHTVNSSNITLQDILTVL